MATIHPTAVVHPAATLGAGVEVGPYCQVGPEVSLGDGTVLHNHVTIQALTTIGARNVVYPYAVLGADPQDRKWRGERATCEIGDGNIIREHVTVHRGTANGGGVTLLGDENLIMVAAHIAHDCRLGDHTTIANQVMLAGHVCVEDHANIGGGAGVHHFATVGRCAFVGGLARISKDVPPFMIVEGNPAEPRAINAIAMARHGYSSEHIEVMKDAFKRLYRDNHATVAEKVEALRRDYATVIPVITLCDALAATAGGIHGRARELERADDKRAPGDS